jgi:hypothetical protein
VHFQHVSPSEKLQGGSVQDCGSNTIARENTPVLELDAAWTTPSRMSSESPKSDAVTMVAIFSTWQLCQDHPPFDSLAFHINGDRAFTPSEYLYPAWSWHLALQSFESLSVNCGPWKRFYDKLVSL